MHQFISFSALKSRTSYSKESGECEDVDECLSSPCLGGDFPVCRKYEEKKFLQLKPSKRSFVNVLMSDMMRYMKKVPRIQLFLRPAFQVLVQICLAALSALANKGGG